MTLLALLTGVRRHRAMRVARHLKPWTPSGSNPFRTRTLLVEQPPHVDREFPHGGLVELTDAVEAR